MTGLIICDATTSFVLGGGDYNVFVTYEGNSKDHLEPNNTTMRIHAI